MTQALFVPEGKHYVPTACASSPWSASQQHGGPPVGLLAWALEQEMAGSGLRLARLTTDLLRPAPMKPVSVRVHTLRRGRRLQVLEAALLHEDTLVTRATALYLRAQPLQVPEHGRFERPKLPPGEAMDGGLNSLATRDGMPSQFAAQGFHSSTRVRWIDGVENRGRGRIWMRMPMPVVAGQPCSPTVQAATLADFGNGVAQLQLAEDLGSINADITLYLHRAPVDEWIGFDARSHMDENGNGLVQTRLHDREGPFGQALQATIPMPLIAAATA